MERKDVLSQTFAENPPKNYKEIVTEVIKLIGDLELCYKRITEINDGYYQGTLLYIIPENSCQPSDYYYVKVSYGSCSVCDTLLRINDCDHETERLNGHMTLALHIVQNLKQIDGDIV